MLEKLSLKYKKSKLSDSRFEFLFDANIGTELVSFDCETTGLNPKKDEILSIGAVKIVGNKIETSTPYERFTTPKGEIDAQSITIHHIRPCDTKSSVDIKVALEEFLCFIGNRTLVGYYISFDIAIINRYLKQIIGTTLPNRSIELSDMYYKRHKKSSAYDFVDLKFDTIMQSLNLPRLGKHDALNDAIMSAMIYLKLRDMPLYKGAYS